MVYPGPTRPPNFDPSDAKKNESQTPNNTLYNTTLWCDWDVHCSNTTDENGTMVTDNRTFCCDEDKDMQCAMLEQYVDDGLGTVEMHNITYMCVKNDLCQEIPKNRSYEHIKWKNITYFNYDTRVICFASINNLLMISTLLSIAYVLII